MKKYFRRIKKLIFTNEITFIGKILYFPFIIFSKRGVAFILIIASILSSFSFGNRNVIAATYYWNQSDWSSGTDAGTYPNHTSNQSGWLKYSNKDTGISTSSGSLILSFSNGSTTQTSDTDFDFGTFSQTVRSGTGEEAGIVLSPSSSVVDTWDTLSSMPADVAYGAHMTNVNGDLYAIPGNTTKKFYKYSASETNKIWIEKADLPSNTYNGSSLLYTGSGDYIYAIATINGSGKDFYRYSISNNTWTAMASTSSVFGSGSRMAYTGSGDYIYALNGDNRVLYRYSISNNTWSDGLASFPSFNGTGLIYASSTPNYLYAHGSDKIFYRYSISGNSWETLAEAPKNFSNSGSLVYTGSGDYIYASLGGSEADFYKYSISGNSWETLSSFSFRFSNGSSLAYPGSGDFLYLINWGTKNFYKYSISENEWKFEYSSKLISGSTGKGQTFIYPGSGDSIYYLRGNHYAALRDFYRYSIVNKTFTALASTTFDVDSSSENTNSIVSGDYIFIIRGNNTKDFYRYSIANDSWTAMASTSVNSGDGGFLVYPGSGDYIYLSRGQTNTQFYRYSISNNSWSSRNALPFSPNLGAAAVATNNDYIYAISKSSVNDFYRYSIANDSWTAMASSTLTTGGTERGRLYYPGFGDYIYGKQGSLMGLSRYSISNNSWSTLALAPEGYGDSSYGNGSMVYPGSGDKFLISDSNGFMHRYNFRSSYLSSGNFISSSIDLGQKSLPVTIDYSAATTTNASVKFQIRSATTTEALATATWYGPSSINDYYTVSGQSINSIHSGDRYIQYKAFFETLDTAETPTLNSVTVNYNIYSSSATLTSSAYNSLSAENIVSKISWTESTSTVTDIKFQIQTAPDNVGVPGSWSGFMGPDGTSGTYFTDPSGGETIPISLSDTVNDQWLQYKVFFTSDNSATPTLSDVSITYVVNAAPEFNLNYPTNGAGGVGAVQNSDGTITINYSIMDSDGDTGSLTPGYITPYFYYSLDGGSTYTLISTSSTMSAQSYQNKAVATSTFTVHTATSTIINQFTGQYDEDAKIKVLINDNEAANSTASSTSAVFTLDTKSPVLGAVPIKIDASQSPAIVTLSATDDSTLQMKISRISDLSDASYVPYSNSTTTVFTSGDTIYAQFKDAKGNTTEIVSATPPTTPSNFFYQDTSNPVTSEWREFFAWGISAIPTRGFAKYNIYRSVNSSDYNLLTNNSNRLINYIVDTGLSTDSTYSYKVSTEDGDGNISFLSTATSGDKPDGIGGSDLAVPVLTNISTSSLGTNGVTISWDTNKLSNSNVYYSATTTYPGTGKNAYDNSIGIPSMVMNHTVSIGSLIPNTKYYFLIESQDASGNLGQSALESYTFTTNSGPSISNVTIAEVFDNEATITWNTNILSNSSVYYSENSDLSDPVIITGSATLTTNHRVRIPSLEKATKYYYYVKSVADENIATDKNIIDGIINYYSFHTSEDTMAPVISDVEAAVIGENGATVIWTTDEAATSQIEFGLSTNLTSSSTESLTYTKQHAVALSGLASSTTYYYRVISKDKSNNSAFDNNGGNMFSFTTLAQNTVYLTSTVYATTTVYLGGGGGGGVMDNRDLTKPVITDIKVDSISGNSVTISFKTSKIATAKIKYGKTTSYTNEAKRSGIYGTSQYVSLINLSPKTLYHFKAYATDIYDNVGESNDMTFTTLESGVVPVNTADLLDTSDLSKEDINLLGKIELASSAMIRNILNSLVKNKNLASVSESQLASSLSALASSAVSTPIISGTDITVDTTSRSATIKWITDKQANSLVAYSKSFDYKGDNIYGITAGFPDEKVFDHKVVLDNLLPSTTYHYQVKSQGTIGAASISSDRTFTTNSLVPDISEARFNSITESSAVLTWKTDLPTKSTIEIKDTTTGKITKVEDSNYLKEHEYKADDLDYSTGYTVIIKALDNDGNSSKPVIIPFNTTLSNEAPKISNVRIISSIIPDHVEKTQSIISWKTDKPATSRVFFADGTATVLNQSTAIDNSLIRDHIVITTLLKPGTIYKISVESSDATGNITRSEPYTVLTQRPQGSVTDLIFKSFNTTFGFLKGK